MFSDRARGKKAHAHGQNKKCAIILFEPITFLMEEDKMNENITLSPEFERLINILDGDNSGNPTAQYELAVLLLKSGTTEKGACAVSGSCPRRVHHFANKRPVYVGSLL